MSDAVATASPPDEQLVRLAQGGDEAAFDALVRRYLPRALRFARRFFRNAEDAADATQETFLRAHTHLDKFDFRGRFSTWFFRIHINVCLNQVRTLQKLKRFFLRPLPPLPESEKRNRVESFAGGSDPHRDQEQDELRRAIESGLQKLPPPQRAVLILYDIEGFSQREIAELLKIPEGTVVSRLYYARRAMQPFLREFHP
jgi:RNA polymerase sigma-70 factor (ECF subfamily)